MSIFTIKNEEPDQVIVELELVKRRGEIIVVATTHTKAGYIGQVNLVSFKDGIMSIFDSAHMEGIKTDKYGRIQIKNYTLKDICMDYSTKKACKDTTTIHRFDDDGIEHGSF